MHRYAGQPAAGGSGPAVKFAGEEDVRQLRVVIGVPGHVAALTLEVVEFDLAGAVCQRGHGYDTRGGSASELRQQQAGEREVAEVIGPELPLEAVGCELARGQGHHSSVVDQQVEHTAA